MWRHSRYARPQGASVIASFLRFTLTVDYLICEGRSKLLSLSVSTCFSRQYMLVRDAEVYVTTRYKTRDTHVGAVCRIVRSDINHCARLNRFLHCVNKCRTTTSLWQVKHASSSNAASHESFRNRSHLHPVPRYKYWSCRTVLYRRNSITCSVNNNE